VGWTIQASNPSGSKIFQPLPDWPEDPPSLLYSGYQVSFLGIKQLGDGVYHHLLLAAELSMGRAMPLPPLSACLACSRTAIIIFFM